MSSPSGSYTVDVEAISGICGSISIACWVVVFSPQILENFRRSSAEGLSVEFVIIWLLGDVFNILGAILQGVLPTMIILAIYYTFADIVLLGQCFYYRGFTLRDPRPDKPVQSEEAVADEETPLITDGDRNEDTHHRPLTAADIEPLARNRSQSSLRERLTSVDATHLSPAAPMHHQPQNAPDTEHSTSRRPRTWTQALFFNGTVVVLVICAGIVGYYLSPSSPDTGKAERTHADDQETALHFSLWGQIFGYICAVLYLGSRIPQLLLNYHRKSTEGLNALFFLFACIGNLTYVLSIFAYEPICSRRHHGHWYGGQCESGEARAVYGKYILVNLSWLLGSLGTLFLDLAVFVQFWMYRDRTKAQGGSTSDFGLSAERGQGQTE